VSVVWPPNDPSSPTPGQQTPDNVSILDKSENGNRSSVQRLVRPKTFAFTISDKNNNQLFDCCTFEGSHTMPIHHQKMVRRFMVDMLEKLHTLNIINQPLNVEINFSASSSDKSSSNKIEKYVIPSD
jgi:hypothetical protein